MAEIILRGQVVPDDWTVLRFPIKDEPVRKQAGKVVVFKITGESSASAEDVEKLEIPDGKVIVPLPVWIARKQALQSRVNDGTLGIWLDSFETLEALIESTEDLNRFSIIAINFPKFNDGRGYSIAYLLRTRYRYTGQIRAIGDVLRDQLFYMNRCGFDAFAMRADRSIHDALNGFKDFSESYQAALDQPEPLFRRRPVSA